MPTKEQHIKPKIRTVCGNAGVEVDALQVGQLCSHSTSKAGEMKCFETVKRRREPYVNYWDKKRRAQDLA